ncbi:MAG: uridine kinase [Acidobacteria bacterium]|nr:uridine kinase [Acidobacteriota bacterium]
MNQERGDRPLIIGIAGGSGSGKTTIAEALAEKIGPDNCAHILHDAYYHRLSHLPMEDRERVNYDHPDSLETELLVEHLHALLHGAAVDVPRYDFAAHDRAEDTTPTKPKPVILLEGVLALAEPTLRDLMDLKIYVDTAADLRFMRRLERDIADRGRTRESVYEQYLATVRPMHIEFVEPSKSHADLVIPEGYNIGAVSTVLGMVREFLRDD